MHMCATLHTWKTYEPEKRHCFGTIFGPAPNRKLDIFQNKGPLHIGKKDKNIHSFKLVSLSKTLIQLDIYTRKLRRNEINRVPVNE